MARRAAASHERQKVSCQLARVECCCPRGKMLSHSHIHLPSSTDTPHAGSCMPICSYACMTTSGGKVCLLALAQALSATVTVVSPLLNTFAPVSRSKISVHAQDPASNTVCRTARARRSCCTYRSGFDSNVMTLRATGLPSTGASSNPERLRMYDTV